MSSLSKVKIIDHSRFHSLIGSDSIRSEYLPFGRPNFGDEEITAVTETLRNGWVGMGKETLKFEEEVFQFLDADHTFKGCCADLNAWYPRLKHEDIFIGHDYYNNEVDPIQKAVAKFVFEQELLSQFEKPLYGSVIYYFFPELKDYRKPLFMM